MHRVPGDLERATTAQRLADTVLPTRHGRFRMTAYRCGSGTEHVALSLGVHDDDPPDAPVPLVRLHSECLTGDALGSRRCDCGEQLQRSLQLLAAAGRGVLVYVRGHEGRGIGLAEKLRAYALQDAGLDTVDANLRLGHLPDARTYDEAAAVLADLGVRRLRLLSSNPAKESALRALGVDVVERVPIVVPARPENARYLRTKRERMGHDHGEDDWEQLLEGTVPSSGELADRYGDLVRHEGPLVLAQLGQSLDGFIASRTGDARSVTGPADREHLHRLRALVDAVVVGGRTAAVDDPRLTVRDVVGPHPVRVVLDPGATLRLTSYLLSDGVAPTLWVVRPSAPVPADLPQHVEVVRWRAEGPMEPHQVLDELRRRGLARVLVEGGGRLVSAFVDAGLVDRLYLTTAPVIIGEGVPGLRVTAAETMAEATRAPVRRWILGEDVVVEVDLAAERAARAAASCEGHRAHEVDEVSSSTG